MTSRRKIGAALVLGAAVVVALVAWGGRVTFPGRHTESENEIPGSAGVTIEDLIDLGSVKNGEIVQVPIRITNESASSSVLDEFRSDCSCVTIYEMQDGVKKKVGKMALGPREEVKVYADIRISGDPGVKRSSSVQFRESGERHRQVGIFFTPVARLYSIPQVAVFGDVPVNTALTRRIELRSDGSFPDRVGVISCSRPELFSVEFMAPGASEKEMFEKSNPGQHLLGNLDLVLRADKTCICEDELIVLNDGKEFLRLLTSARVVEEYQLSPGALVLPRAQSNGEPLYSANVVCRARGGFPVKVQRVEDDLPFDVRVANSGESTSPIITIRYSGPTPVSEPRVTYELRFKVIGGEKEAVLKLPVILTSRR